MDSKDIAPSGVKSGYVPTASSVEPAEDLPIEAAGSRHLPTEQINRIIELATKTFEDAQYANDWLNRPNPATDDKPPIALLGTDLGFKRVETLIRRLPYGIVA